MSVSLLHRHLVLGIIGIIYVAIWLLIDCGPASAQTQLGSDLTVPVADGPHEADVPTEIVYSGLPARLSDCNRIFNSCEPRSLTSTQGVTSGSEFITKLVSSDGATETGLVGLIRESLFGTRGDLWRPLTLGTFFSEGWNEPWRASPRSTTDTPRQGWINAYDGVFYRLAFIDFQYQNNNLQNGNEYLGTIISFIPISRRFQMRFDVPFIASNKGGENNNYHGNFGDFVISPRFLLSERRDFSQVVECLVSTPTGQQVNGNGQTTLTPQYEFCHGGLPWRSVIRGGTGLTIPTNDLGARTTYNYNLAIGKYWTPREAMLGDFLTFLAVNGYSTVDNLGPAYTFLSVTPGLRFHLRHNYYLLSGIEVPLTGPTNQSFAWAPNFWFTKVW